MEILPTLTAPIKGGVLVMYLAASVESISVVLLAEREERQIPIYYVSRVLQGVELNYHAIEKLILSHVHAARRLRRYFQIHRIRVLSDAPIKQMLTSPEKSGRIAKWAIEVSKHDIDFKERGSRKTHIPKDFSIEIPPEEGKKVVTRRADTGKEGPKFESIWNLYTDGASSSDGSGAGLILISPKGREYTYALRFEFETTNNEAEYEALLAGLRITREIEIKSLAIFTDSQIMANQIKGIFEVRQPTIKQYLEKVKEVLKGFDTFTIEHVRRNQNKKADALSKLVSMTFKHLTKEVLVEVLAKRSINDKEVSKALRSLITSSKKHTRDLAPRSMVVRIMKSLQWIKNNAELLSHNGACGNNEPHQEATSLISARMGGYHSPEAIPPSTKSVAPISKEHNSKDKRKEGKDREVASIEEAYYQNKLQKYHDTRSIHFSFKLGDFVLLSQGNKDGYNVWQGPHIISRVYEGEIYKITNASDYSLVQSAKGTSL
ncbi:reverse transcriptase domain-containing protein, partial [Tanacetum coccineum]